MRNTELRRNLEVQSMVYLEKKDTEMVETTTA